MPDNISSSKINLETSGKKSVLKNKNNQFMTTFSKIVTYSIRKRVDELLNYEHTFSHTKLITALPVKWTYKSPISALSMKKKGLKSIQ